MVMLLRCLKQELVFLTTDAKQVATLKSITSTRKGE